MKELDAKFEKTLARKALSGAKQISRTEFDNLSLRALNLEPVDLGTHPAPKKRVIKEEERDQLDSSTSGAPQPAPEKRVSLSEERDQPASTTRGAPQPAPHNE